MWKGRSKISWTVATKCPPKCVWGSSRPKLMFKSFMSPCTAKKQQWTGQTVHVYNEEETPKYSYMICSYPNLMKFWKGQILQNTCLHGSKHISQICVLSNKFLFLGFISINLHRDRITKHGTLWVAQKLLLYLRDLMWTYNHFIEVPICFLVEPCSPLSAFLLLGNNEIRNWKLSIFTREISFKISKKITETKHATWDQDCYGCSHNSLVLAALAYGYIKQRKQVHACSKFMISMPVFDSFFFSCNTWMSRSCEKQNKFCCQMNMTHFALCLMRTM